MSLVYKCLDRDNTNSGLVFLSGNNIDRNTTCFISSGYYSKYRRKQCLKEMEQDHAERDQGLDEARVLAHLRNNWSIYG